MEQGISVLAVTDHDVIWGAQELAAMSRTDPDLEDLQVIVGEEITTSRGEIIGLFLRERISPGIEPSDAVRQIHDQGGLVLLPHGFDRYKAGHLRAAARREIAASIDIVETFNRRVSLPRYNRRAREWADANGKLVSAGTDAHTLAEVGTAWTEVPDATIESPDDLRAALEEGEVLGGWRQPLIAYVEKLWTRIRGAF